MPRPLLPVLLAALSLACFSEENTTGGATGPATETSAMGTSTSTPTSTTASASDSDATDSASASASTGSVESSTSESSGSTTTGATQQDPYGRCFDFALGGCGYLDQCEEGCLRNYDDDLQTCTWQCGIGKECPQPLDGDAPASCEQMFGYRCILDCSAGQTCPTGMVCDAITNSFGGPEVMACAWPTTEWLPPYSACYDVDFPGCSLCSLTGAGSACAIDSEPECPDPQKCNRVCLPDCGDLHGDCPAAPEGAPQPTCLPVGEGVGFCAIECGGGTCPDGMQCEQWDGLGGVLSICMWPPA